MKQPFARPTVWFGLVGLACAARLLAQGPENLSEAQMREFLLNAKVVRYRQVSKGITGTYRLTLNDGTMEHDASFQAIDQNKAREQLSTGITEVNFRDSYKFNIAAFEIAKLLGLGDMMPVTVERKWNGRTGSLSWWLPAKMDEEKRRKDKITPPDVDAFNKQMYRMYVFGELVYDTDRNQGNVVFSEDWRVWMIDFTRAFRMYPDLPHPKLLIMCQRSLFEKMRQLTAADIKQATRYLDSLQISGLLQRRDKIIAHFEKMIAQKGEAAVLYD
jgi:hypothetical protein